MNITSRLSENSENNGDKEAIAYINSNNKRFSMNWRDLEEYSNRVANMLISLGVKKNNKVAILMSNSLFWLPIYFGILKLGAIVVPLSHNNSDDEILYCINHVECTGVFIDDNSEHSDVLEESKKDKFFVLAVNQYSFDDFLSSYSNEKININILDTDAAAIYFSSGTTGRTKAILLSHGSIYSTAEMELFHHKHEKCDRYLCLSPLYHIGAIMHWFGSLFVGGAVVIYNSNSPNSIVSIIEKEKISIVWLLVPHIQDILDAIDSGDIDINICDLSSLRLMHSGAQPVPKDLIMRWHSRFPSVEYDTNYGLTESGGPGCIHLGIENLNKAGSIGKPDNNWQINIVDEEGNILDKGAIGELILKGPGNMIGYYKDIVATKNTLKDGWLYTGDMAYIDEEGFVYLVDRKKDIIIFGGVNIYPVQIENVIRTLDFVKDVAVIGLPNKRYGEIVGAVIEVKEGYEYSKREVYEHCKKLPEYQRPLKVYFDVVARNSTGKVDKRLIRNSILKYK